MRLTRLQGVLPWVRILAFQLLLGEFCMRATPAQTLVTRTNIGNAQVLPSVTFSNAIYRVATQGGGGLSGKQDQCAFVFQTVLGDTEIVARLDTLLATDPEARAGVMVRSSLDANAPQATIVLTSGTGTEFLTRSATGLANAQTTWDTDGIPKWVRLVRQGDCFTGFYSSDGLRWRQGGSLTINMPMDVQLGLVIASTNPCQAIFSHVDFLDSTRRPSLAVYSWPPGIPESDKYQVNISQAGVSQSCFVHISHPEDRLISGTAAGRTLYRTTPGKTLSWANFSFWGPVTIEVKKLFGSAATNVVISPKSYGVVPKVIDGNTVRFTLNSPRYVSVDFDIPENHAPQRPSDIEHGLMLFADPPELSPPHLGDPGVVEFNAALDQSSANVLYLQAGKIYFGPGNRTSSGIFDTNSANGNLVMAPGQCLYIAGGAYAYLSHWQGVPNTSMCGRGVVSGVKQVFGVGGPGNWQTFVISDCVEGPTLVDLPHHALGESPNAVIRQVKILNAWWPNQDGIRGGTNSLVENCFLKCCDDNFYPGFNIRRCVIWPAWNGATIQLGWGAYNSWGTQMTDCDLINPEWDHFGFNDGFFDAAALGWSAKTELHNFDNIRIEGSIPALINLNLTTETNAPSAGYIQNVIFRNIVLEKPQSTDAGLSRSRIQGLMLNGQPAYVRDWIFEHVQIGGVLVTSTNAAAHFDIDPLTTTNLQFRTGGLRLALQQVDGQALISFETYLNLQYRVLFRDSFSSSSWQTLVDQIPGTGNSYSLIDVIDRSKPSWFYQVERLP
jgi:hypothetical protein